MVLNMIDTINCNIDKIALHKVGNKLENENVHFSRSLLFIEDTITRILLLNFFTIPFKSSEYFNFYHNIDINMNEVFVCVSKIFDNPNILLEQSVNLAKHLYEQSTHPKIKGGEFYTVYFKDCIIDGETVDAVGLFKSENKDTFLKIFPKGDGFEIESEKGININKLDKGCLIFNTERESGYIVAVVDNTNKGVEAQYWIDDFLHVRQRKDEYYNTQNIVSLTKNFVQNSNLSKADQSDLLNKAVTFLKEKDNFDIAEFAHEVIGQPEVIEKFNQYKSAYAKEYEIEIADSFTISDSAVKKQARVLKNVIKLDKNFDIHIHGNRDLIEQGKDARGKFYKIYYKEEA
ncbi:hypothetical protein AGMMS49525_16760 [Bacteroidia bacterium]|nr:hypothetical protein AGMMS49525_16760 [Bacteroidia bacterium]